MPIHRYYADGAPVFITQVTAHRQPLFADHVALELLRATLRTVKKLHPFTMLAYVFLPNHMHLLVHTEPPVEAMDLMHSLKPAFTKAYRKTHATEDALAVWQARFWDHVIRDQEDMNRHVDYIHYNPVRHGSVDDPVLWTESSFREWQKRGFYPEGWGQSYANLINELSRR